MGGKGRRGEAGWLLWKRLWVEIAPWWLGEKRVDTEDSSDCVRER